MKCLIQCKHTGPQSIIVAGKEAIRKVLIEDDLMKSPILDKAKDDINVSNLFNERNKLAHKQKVCAQKTGVDLKS
jgi:hypothetical protein